MAAMGGGLFALYGHEEILKKSSSLKTSGQILKEFHRNLPLVTLLTHSHTMTPFDASGKPAF